MPQTPWMIWMNRMQMQRRDNPRPGRSSLQPNHASMAEMASMNALTQKQIKEEHEMSNHAFRYTRLILILVILLSILTVTASATTAARSAASTPAKGHTTSSPTMPASTVVQVPQSAPQGVASAPATAPDGPFQYAPDAAVPLTPDGNLTLQDDLQNAMSGDLQFLTVRTKAGNTFYLVIDRAAKENNVHFLNLVDEADLLALLKKEAGGASLDGFGSASETTGTGAGNDLASGGFSLEWPGSGDSASSGDSNGTGDDSTSGSEVPFSTSAPVKSNSQVKPVTPHVSNSTSPSPDSSSHAPEDSFASKMKAYASLGFLLLLLVGGGVLWLVRTLRKRKALRAKHPTDEYLYVEEQEVPDSADRQECPSRHDARIDTDDDGEDLA